MSFHERAGNKGEKVITDHMVSLDLGSFSNFFKILAGIPRQNERSFREGKACGKGNPRTTCSEGFFHDDYDIHDTVIWLASRHTMEIRLA